MALEFVRGMSTIAPMPDPDNPRPHHGIYKAKVSDNNDPDKRGRLKLVIPQVTGDAEHPSWALPLGLTSTPGAGYGSLDLPHVGDWVWVEFEGQMPEEPRWSPGWWAKDELPDAFKGNYPEVRGVVTKQGHSILIDDKDNKITITHSGGATVVLDSSSATVDAGAVYIVANGSHPLPFFDDFLRDLVPFLTSLVAVLQAGTVGTPLFQQLVALPGVQANLQQFIAKCAASLPYLSTKAKVG